MANRKLRLYNCGGTGCNIGSRFMKFANKVNHGFAEIDCVFVDTSKSNLSALIPEAQVYLVQGKDGSGGLRSSNYEAISECHKEVLHQFKPADVNIVLSSAGGGSGSVIAPVLVSALLERNENVIVITIGGTSTRKETENTLKTLQSYETISRKRGKPVVMAYRENAISKPRSEVDAEIEMMIPFLAAIFSGDNHALDSADLSNFLNYQLVTSYTPKLSHLDFFSKNIEIAKGQTIVSLVSLIDENTSSEVPMPIGYHPVGYLPQATKETLSTDLPLHAAVISGYFNTVSDALQAKLAVYDEHRETFVEKPIVGGNVSSTDDGLVL